MTDENVKTNFAIRVFFCLLVVVAFNTHLSAKPWRGIEPFRSTRSDVVHLLNRCLDQKEACSFTLEKEQVYILFSSGLDSEYRESAWAKRLLAGTVIFIEIRPVSPTKFARSELSKQKFIASNPTAPWKLGYSGYIDANEGLAIKTYKGKVVQLVYLPSLSDMLLAHSYYGDPQSFIEIYKGHVPAVWLNCPKDPVTEGLTLVLSARSDFDSKRGFGWTVSAGRISAGQNTSTITIDTSGLAGQTIIAAAEVYEIDRNLIAIGDCKIQVVKEKF